MNWFEDINTLEINRVKRIKNIKCFAGYCHAEGETWSESRKKTTYGRLQVAISSRGF
jgi:hypothetical protein